MIKSYQNIIKPLADFSAALVLLIVLFPLLLLITLLLAFHFKGSPLFLQQRIGKNEKLFKILKFRTMRKSLDPKEDFTQEKNRITRIGYFLRATALDELPQLLNVLKGEMSFIGPRPLLPHYLAYLTPTASIRHKVKPGISGLAQINGGAGLEWKKRFEYDFYYVNNVCPILDFQILLKTPFYLLSNRNLKNIGPYIKS